MGGVAGYIHPLGQNKGGVYTRLGVQPNTPLYIQPDKVYLQPPNTALGGFMV